jgi:hypothetical protein
VIVYLGAEALNLFKDLPSEGALFPHLSRVRAGDRATEFGSRCRQLGIKGVTLHSYLTRRIVKMTAPCGGHFTPPYPRLLSLRPFLANTHLRPVPI